MTDGELPDYRPYFASELQDVVHYAGSLCHHYGIRTQHGEFTFEQPDMRQLTRRMEMLQRAEQKLAVALRRAVGAELMYLDAGIVMFIDDSTTPIEDEVQLRDRAAVAYSLCVRLSAACGVDAFKGVVLA